MAALGSNSAVPFPPLRFVGGEVSTPTKREAATARRSIAIENHSALAFAAEDIRWIMAEEVQAALDGGRAAILRPEARRRLVSSAVQRGLRPFDANLIIAIVQDGARQGEPMADQTLQRVQLLPAVQGASSARPLLLLAGAVVGAAALMAFLVAWVLG